MRSRRNDPTLAKSLFRVVTSPLLGPVRTAQRAREYLELSDGHHAPLDAAGLPKRRHGAPSRDHGVAAWSAQAGGSSTQRHWLRLGLAATGFGLPFAVASAMEEVAATALDVGPEVRMPTSADDPRFADHIFHSDRGFTPFVSTDHSTSRHRIIDGQGYAETKLIFKGDTREVANLLRDKWDFYGGAYLDPKRHEDGSISYELWPTGKILDLPGKAADVGLRVFERMGEPLPMGKDGEDGYRIPITLRGGAQGLAYLEVRKLDDGNVEVSGRFAGVTGGQLGNAFPLKMFLTNHLLVEAGRRNEIPGIGLVQDPGGGFVAFIDKVVGRKAIPDVDYVRSRDFASVLSANGRPVAGARIA